MLTIEKQYVEWTENENGNDTLHNDALHNNTLHKARWLSSSDQAAPAHIEVINDSTSADKAYRLVCAGISLLYRGDFHNARQLLQAMTRRIERSEQRKSNKAASNSKNTTIILPMTPYHQLKSFPIYFISSARRQLSAREY